MPGRMPALIGVACAALIASGARAELVAIVEDAPADAPVALFEFLPEGHSFTLAPGQRIVLSYLTSCRQETIEGGSVVIGAKRSANADGLVSKRVVPCDTAGLDLTTDEAGGAGVFLVRRVETPGPEPDLTVHGTRPLFVGAPGSVVRIRRIDRPGAETALPVEAGRATLAAGTNELVRGGLYEAVSGTASVVFRVDKLARADAAPLSRLIPF